MKQPLNEEEIRKLCYLLEDLQSEYEQFRRGHCVMESPLLYNARMIVADLKRRDLL